jgi:hypothetical protein
VRTCQKIRIQKFSSSISWRRRTTKADAVDLDRRVVEAAVGHAQVDGIVDPTAPAQHPGTIRVGSRAGRVAGRRDTLITAVIPVIHPLPHVSGHIHYAVRAGPGWITAHRAGVADTITAVVEVGS